MKEKILAIVQKVYGGAGVQYTDLAEERIAKIDADPALRTLPVCMSKTQYSLSDDATKLGAPSLLIKASFERRTCPTFGKPLLRLGPNLQHKKVGFDYR